MNEARLVMLAQMHETAQLWSAPMTAAAVRTAMLTGARFVQPTWEYPPYEIVRKPRRMQSGLRLSADRFERLTAWSR